MKRVVKTVKKAIVNVARKSASMEANTACTFFNFQPEEPKNVKKLRKF